MSPTGSRRLRLNNVRYFVTIEFVNHLPLTNVMRFIASCHGGKYNHSGGQQQFAAGTLRKRRFEGGPTYDTTRCRIGRRLR
jgi:hypothetical protein